MGGVDYDDYAKLKVRAIECFAQAKERGEMRTSMVPPWGGYKGIINFRYDPDQMPVDWSR
jgi:hypothetical protein